MAEEAASEQERLRVEAEDSRMVAEDLLRSLGTEAAQLRLAEGADEVAAQQAPEETELVRPQQPATAEDQAAIPRDSVMPRQPLPTPNARGLHVITPSPVRCHDTDAVRKQVDTHGFCVVKDRRGAA